MERYLVSGIHGFIGSRLSERLSSSGAEVNAWERHQTASEALSCNPNYIVHLAAYGNHANQKETQETWRVNVWRFLELLEASKSVDYKGMVVIGSSSEYGQKSEPMTESDVCRPTTQYGASKVAATAMATAFAHEYHKPIVVVRPFSIFGPGEADHRFMPTVIRNLYNGQVFPLDPLAVHDWTFVDDFVSGIIMAGNNAQEMSGRVVNFGTGVQTTNLEVVQCLERITNRKAHYQERGSMRWADSTRWQANINLAKSLGWTQKFDLQKGLEATVEDYCRRRIK